MSSFDFQVENSGRTVQYKLNAQSLRLFGLYSDVNDAHRAGAKRLQNKQRLYSGLDQAQPEDQGGFRRSHQTLDHLATYRLLEQKCREWCIKMWVATVDFMKAFDSKSHQSSRKALEKCGTESHVCCILTGLFAEQKGSASTDNESDMFEIKRGTTKWH